MKISFGNSVSLSNRNRAKLEQISFNMKSNNLNSVAKDSFTSKLNEDGSDAATFDCGYSHIDLYNC